MTCGGTSFPPAARACEQLPHPSVIEGIRTVSRQSHTAPARTPGPPRAAGPLLEGPHADGIRRLPPGARGRRVRRVRRLGRRRARWLGYRTFRANRADAATEQLGVESDCVGRGLDDLVSFV